MKYCTHCGASYPDDYSTCPRDQNALITSHELQPGMVIRNKYRILSKIGSGGMGAVYQARHVVFDELRAIKVVNGELSNDRDFLARFKTEAIVARRLNHPNAVRVEDLDVMEDGRPFLVMELVEGHSLREVIKQMGAMPLGYALEIARQVANALQAAHELRIVHRDIKPDNILLTRCMDGTIVAKVLDFGIAKIRDDSIGASSTVTGMIVGTPQYISPEQAMGKKGSQLDGRADVYSLGVVVYEMLTGRVPFESDTPIGFVLHHLNTPPPALQQVRPDLNLPETVNRVLMKSLQKDPKDRFQSARELAEALAHLQDTTKTVAKANSAADRAVGKAAQVQEREKTPATAQMPAEPAFAPRPAPVVQADSPGEDAATTSGVTPALRPPSKTPLPSSSKTLKRANWLYVAITVVILILAGLYGGYRALRPSAVSVVNNSTATELSHGASPAARITTGQQAQVQGLLRRGHEQLDAGEYREALASFQRAAALDSTNPTATQAIQRTQQAEITEKELLRNR